MCFCVDVETLYEEVSPIGSFNMYLAKESMTDTLPEFEGLSSSRCAINITEMIVCFAAVIIKAFARTHAVFSKLVHTACG